MSVLAVAAPWIAGDAHRASHPPRESGRASYAAARVQTFSWADGLFPWAVFAQTGISMGGGGTDSWDSRLGPYNPATAGSNGDLTSNGDITLNNATIVKGDVSAGYRRRPSLPAPPGATRAAWGRYRPGSRTARPAERCRSVRGPTWF